MGAHLLPKAGCTFSSAEPRARFHRNTVTGETVSQVTQHRSHMSMHRGCGRVGRPDGRVALALLSWSVDMPPASATLGRVSLPWGRDY